MNAPAKWAAPFPFLTPAAIAQMEALPALYAEWNAQINVISRKDEDGIWERHILHSLCLGGPGPFVETCNFSISPKSLMSDLDAFMQAL